MEKDNLSEHLSWLHIKPHYKVKCNLFGTLACWASAIWLSICSHDYVFYLFLWCRSLQTQASKRGITHIINRSIEKKSENEGHIIIWSLILFQTESGGEVSTLTLPLAASLLCLSGQMKPQATVTLHLVSRDGSGQTSKSSGPPVPTTVRRESSAPTELAHVVLTHTQHGSSRLGCLLHSEGLL